MTKYLRRLSQLLVFLFVLGIPVLSMYSVVLRQMPPRVYGTMVGGIAPERVTPSEYMLEPMQKKAFEVVDATLLPFFEDHEVLVKLLDGFKGTPWSITISGYTMTDPLAVIVSTLSTKSIYTPFVLTAIIPIVLLLVFGRGFCSWVCPMFFLFELNRHLRQLLDKILTKVGLNPVNITFPRYYKYIFLGMGLLLSITGFSILPYLVPYIMVGKEVFYLFYYLAFSTSIWIIVFFLLFELLISDRGWCRYLCPAGGFIALAGANRLVRVKFADDKCTDCGKCDRACGFGLKPREEGTGLECDNCGECVHACPTDALNYGIVLPGTKKENVPSKEGFPA